MRTTKSLIRLGGCPGWSSLGAHSLCRFCHVAAQIFFCEDHLWHYLKGVPLSRKCHSQWLQSTLSAYSRRKFSRKHVTTKWKDKYTDSKSTIPHSYLLRLVFIRDLTLWTVRLKAVMVHVKMKWAKARQIIKMICAPSEDSDQPGYPSGLIVVFACFNMGHLFMRTAKTQAVLSLFWAHVPFFSCFDSSGL